MPVARVVLSHPLRILALVSRYLTNKLIRYEPLPGRNSSGNKEMPSRYIARYYPLVRMAMPVPRVGYPYITAPFATFPTSCPVVLVRLACLIHAAYVRSEPGSNPSKSIRFPRRTSTRQVKNLPYFQPRTPTGFVYRPAPARGEREAVNVDNEQKSLNLIAL